MELSTYMCNENRHHHHHHQNINHGHYTNGAALQQRWSPLAFWSCNGWYMIRVLLCKCVGMYEICCTMCGRPP